MEFTKEQIETAKKILESYRVVQNRHHNFENYLDSLLKPETKFIDVRIEYESDNFPLTADRVKSALELKYDITFRNFKVTELPEVFTREDMIDFAQYNYEHSSISKVTNLDTWLSESKSK